MENNFYGFVNTHEKFISIKAVESLIFSEYFFFIVSCEFLKIPF